MAFVDPTESIEQHVDDALAPFRRAMKATTDRAQRRKIRRRMAERERRIRRALAGNGTAW